MPSVTERDVVVGGQNRYCVEMSYPRNVGVALGTFLSDIHVEQNYCADNFHDVDDSVENVL